MYKTTSSKPHAWLWAAALILIIAATFPLTMGEDPETETQDDVVNVEEDAASENITVCANLTESTCCNNTQNLVCSLCQGTDPDNAPVCRNTDSCEAEETDMCEAPAVPTTQAPITCEDLNATFCCNSTALSNCSLCQSGDNEGVCRTECEAEETDTCASVEPVDPTTEPPTTTPGGNDTTTTAGTTTAGTTAPESTTSNSKGGGSGQSFDGASFVGGIILSIGIVAIIFFGLKFYKARRDANYHTL